MKEKTWKEIPWGGLILEAGNAQEYHTGDWRVEKPIHDTEKCTDCMICWILCPDTAIIVKDKKIVGVDYDYCKGCGICVKECPFDAIEMVPEGKEVD
ncbi:MAG: 4Fe-4S binding protein [Candidatus Methanofastidiosia archaeon]